MRHLRFSLFTKIMLWFFLNLALLAAVLFFIFNLNFRFAPGRSFFGNLFNRMETVSRLVTDETQGASKPELDAVLKKYSEAYSAEFFIFENDGKQLAGREIALPPEVYNEITRIPPPPPNREARPRNSNPPPPGRSPFFYTRTNNPTLYWSASPITLFGRANEPPVRALLVVASNSFTGGGLFFDPTPWLLLIAVIVGVSILFWLPFVRGITRSVAEMTTAAENIAEERFEIRVDERRGDEIGRLGAAINHLATRLSGFVSGQKRFLGDISHELNSPLARMQFALSILEDRVDANSRGYVADVKEEVELMTKLVSELLTYSRAGIKSADGKLERVSLRPLIERAIEREADNAVIKLAVDEKITVLAQPELLARAVGNVFRNAVRYAGEAGEIKIVADRLGERVNLTITDKGAGVPEAELEKIFDPFYRVDTARTRESGGTGLGLAIVKTCVEACGGTVYARNVALVGFEIVISLQT